MVPDHNIKLIIVDDHPVVLEGLAGGLGQNSSINIIGTAPDFDSGKSLILEGGFDILLSDLYLADRRDGLELVRLARNLHPRCKTLVLTYSTKPDDVHDATEAGAHAYLLKDSDLDEIVDAFGTVLAGGRPPLPPALEAAVWERARSRANGNGYFHLSDREIDVLKLMTGGFTNQEIAAKLFLSDRVIRRCNTSMYRKLDVRNRSEAVAKALKENLV